jgi:prefoldin subunit 5
MMHFIVDETPESDITFMQERIKFLENIIKDKNEKIENLECRVDYWKTENAKLQTKIIVLQSNK